MKKVLLLLLCMPLFFSCSKDDEENEPLKLNESSISIYSDQTFQLNAISGDKTNIKWISENKFVATISSNGLVKAEHVGKTKIMANNVICEVTVNPRSKLYTEPYLKWGASISEIKSKYGTPTSETSTMLTYVSSNSTNPITAYVFENGKLKGAGSYVSTTYTSQLGDFLKERYETVSVTPNEDIILILENEDINTGVGLQMYNVNYWMVMYLPLSKSTLRSSKQFSISDEMKLEVEKLLKENDNLKNETKWL